jgi:hypothetical protein
MAERHLGTLQVDDTGRGETVIDGRVYELTQGENPALEAIIATQAEGVAWRVGGAWSSGPTRCAQRNWLPHGPRSVATPGRCSR